MEDGSAAAKPETASLLRACIQVVRPHQWVKNIFILAPLFFSHQLLNWESLQASAQAFLFFSLLSSAVYILNDITDRKSDRLAPNKSKRPLANGTLSLTLALCLLTACLAAAALIGSLSDFAKDCLIWGGLYGLINIAYNAGMKQIPILEKFLVSSGYVIRILLGSAAIGQTPSFWILFTTASVSFLLVAGKRRDDLAMIEREGLPLSMRPVLAHYSRAFLDQVIMIAASVTIMTYLLFCMSDYAIHRYGESFAFSAVFVVFGVLRYVQITQLGRGADAPTTLVMQDGILRISILLWSGYVAYIAYG
ncbi:UbiA prenyltransferase family protein [Aestuariispira insulae]|uniref:4-hydroxybenzoate polyprenyltransferase n=1 Tax=Aestuariispira insulae TaxID=1461337 RepID=A0A3D9HSN6_9PROT|nr:UbiA prenyltransferase family protein [Aestuariispira insulae]RED52361.1 4-hydroxybenzoate polyprenyltransferase [Aestuariispira insulae]